MKVFSQTELNRLRGADDAAAPDRVRASQLTRRLRRTTRWTGLAIRTAAAEVGHHLRREAVARSVVTMSRAYRTYTVTLLGDYLDIRGQQAKYPDVNAND